jgi:cytochrome oxidase Cu insertion factor (SCO1/SenC/PrrC family)
MAKHRLVGEGRHYLLGGQSALAPVWLAYGIGTTPIVQGSSQPGGPAQFGRVGHTDATFLIDRDGRKRALLRSEATATEIAAGLRVLLR